MEHSDTCLCDRFADAEVSATLLFMIMMYM